MTFYIFFEMLSCHFLHFFLIWFHGIDLVFYCLEKTVVQHVITFNLFPGAMFLFQHHFVKGVIHFFQNLQEGFIPEHIEMPKKYCELKLLNQALEWDNFVRSEYKKSANLLKKKVMCNCVTSC